MANTITDAVIASAKADIKAKFPSEVAEAVLTIVQTAVDQVYADLALLDARVVVLEP